MRKPAFYNSWFWVCVIETVKNYCCDEINLLFGKTYEGGYAIGAFNVNNMEIVQGITEAAGELSSPAILQESAGARKYANHTYLVKLVEAEPDPAGGVSPQPNDAFF